MGHLYDFIWSLAIFNCVLIIGVATSDLFVCEQDSNFLTEVEEISCAHLWCRVCIWNQ